MPTRVMFVSLFAISLCPLAAWGDNLDVAVTACEGNPVCSHGARDQSGQMQFHILREGFTLSLKCGVAGECVKVLPKGKSAKVSDALLLLTSK